jgi:DNA polymerase I
MYFWYDNTGHLPYCLTSIAKEEMELFERVKNHEGFDHFETVKRFDPLNDKEIEVTKIVCKDPQAVGGRPGSSIRDIIPEDYKGIFGVSMQDAGAKIWEARIKYYQSYIFDRKLQPGMIYEVKDGNLVEAVDITASENLAKIRDTFKECSEEERSYAEMWAKLLEYPAPQFRRAAIDIEVYSPLANRVPDAREGACPVIACSIYSSDGDKKVLVLKREGVKSGDPN